MSAIGDARAAYAQNEKNLQRYETRLAAGELPLQRGHVLSPDDLRVRKHAVEPAVRIDPLVTTAERELSWWQQAAQRLDAARRDGLVQFEGDQLSVTETGRTFLRQVCAALDPHQQLDSQDQMRASA